MNKKIENILKDLANEIDILNDMLTSLVEILEEKGILTQKEWESRIKSKIETKKGKRTYRDIQFQR